MDSSLARELLLIGSTEITGAPVTEASPDSQGALKVSDIFEASYDEGKQDSHHSNFEITVTALPSKKCYKLDVCPEETVGSVKERIEETSSVAANKMSLVHSGNHEEDDRTLAEAGIGSHSNLHMFMRIKGGKFDLDLSELDSAFNYDFTNEKPTPGEKFMRGKFEYKRPYGWYRLAIRVRGRYENDNWLGPNGIRQNSAQGEWPVSYHGTPKKNADGILEDGFHTGQRAVFGKGVYTSPTLDVVAGMYAPFFTHGADGKKYKMVFQTRVNPAPGHLTIIDKSQTHVDAEYWISPLHDKKTNQLDVRPYGILFKKVSS